MIKSEKQKTKTLKIIENLKKDRDKFLEISQNLPKEVIEAHVGSTDSMMGELERELKEYEELKIGKFKLPKNISFIELLRSLAKIRISRGLSQQNLANLIGVSKQQLNRYEEHDYQNIGVEKINMILEAFNINFDIKTRKKAA